jgi:hypothetical protein
MKKTRNLALALAACSSMAVIFAIVPAGSMGGIHAAGQQPPKGQASATTSGLGAVGPAVNGTPDDPLRDPREVHLRHVHQLTFGGQNAEAYFSSDGRQLIFQSTRPPYECDQMFVMNADGSGVHLVSTGHGRTTCGYFYPDGKHILYASTHEASGACPPRPDYSQGYVWGVYSDLLRDQRQRAPEESHAMEGL